MFIQDFVAICAVAVALGLPSNADVSFSDGVFDNANWTLALYEHTGTADAPTAFQVAAGGNPNEYRRINHNNFTGVIVSHHLRAGAIYNPAASGAIASLDFSLDQAALVSLNNINVATGLLIFQNNTYYSSQSFLNNSPRWQHFTINLTATDFAKFGNPDAHPDFSATAPPMQLGLSAWNDNVGFLASRAVAVDNWAVTVHPVTTCAADTNHDQAVNVNDLLAVINGWGACPPPCPRYCAADVNHDCVVNVNDLLAVINGWGPCP